MDFDITEARRRELDRALAAKAELEAKLAEAARAARGAKARLLATTKSESWHRHSLGWLDRDAGYTGEMASARVYLRSLPFADYVRVLAPHAADAVRNIDAEVRAVNANLEESTERGDDLLLDRARRDYVAEVASFRQWQADNPDKKGWRELPPTRNQLFQISRNAAKLGIEMPPRVNRGEAHDWIEAHGGNLRLIGDEAEEPTMLANPGGTTAGGASAFGTSKASVLDVAADTPVAPASADVDQDDANEGCATRDAIVDAVQRGSPAEKPS